MEIPGDAYTTPETFDLSELSIGRRLFELQPSLRPLFKISLEEQSRKLLDTLRAVVESLDRFDELRPQLLELGRKFDPETRAAWDQMLRLISEIMLEGAKS